MRKAFLFFVLVFFINALQAQQAKPDTARVSKTKPDTVKVGIYLTSIHNIDFKQKEFDVHFWIWFNYKNKTLDFTNLLEIPNAKSFTKLYDSVYVTKDGFYELMKYQCTMNDSWKVTNFPFDRQTLRIRFENSQFNSDHMVFAVEKRGEQYDVASAKKGRLLYGWNIDSFKVSAYAREYKTDFGDKSLAEPKEVYSSIRVRAHISRPVFGLFMKTFLGMYIAFLIAFVCFFIHEDGIDSRFSLSVGSLFAVIGNKYIIDSSLPETTSFTLVDTLHGLTLLVIFIVVASTAVSLRLIKKDKIKKARRMDFIVGLITLLLYLAANFYFILDAIRTVEGN